jgi:hypothetical protein
VRVVDAEVSREGPGALDVPGGDGGDALEGVRAEGPDEGGDDPPGAHHPQAQPWHGGDVDRTWCG